MGTSADGPYKFEKTKDDMPAIVLWGRTLVALALIPLAISAFHDEYGSVPLVNGIDLAVHEFGHPFFGVVFFGNETMTVLGGSLFQTIFPLFFAAYFLWPREGRARDVHAAMVCIWWCGINMLDVSIYMGDSVKQQLVLITGETGAEGGPHDWHWLLLHWHVLVRDQIYAARLRGLGKLLCGASIVVALLWTWRAKLVSPTPTPSEQPANV